MLGKLSQSLFMLGPVVQCSRIEVRPVGPDQRFDLGINSNLVEQFRTAQGAVQLAGENRTKIKPVMTASKKTPVMISIVLMMWP